MRTSQVRFPRSLTVSFRAKQIYLENRPHHDHSLNVHSRQGQSRGQGQRTPSLSGEPVERHVKLFVDTAALEVHYVVKNPYQLTLPYMTLNPYQLTLPYVTMKMFQLTLPYVTMKMFQLTLPYMIIKMF